MVRTAWGFTPAPPAVADHRSGRVTTVVGLSTCPKSYLRGYNLAGCCRDSGGMRMSSKNPKETGRNDGMRWGRQRDSPAEMASPFPGGPGVSKGKRPLLPQGPLLQLYYPHGLSSPARLQVRSSQPPQLTAQRETTGTRACHLQQLSTHSQLLSCGLTPPLRP